MNFSFLHIFKRYIISFLAAIIITAVLQGLLSLLFTFIHPPENVITIICGASSYFCVFCAALLFSGSCLKHGFFSGLLCADFSMLILIICGMLALNNTLTPSSLVRIFALCSLCGGIGGILGINFKTK